MSSRRGFVRLLYRINEMLASLGVVCLLILTGIIAANIFMRYLFNAPISWADEFASYFLLGLIFFGLAYALQDDTHIKVDFVVMMLPEKVRYPLSVVVHLIGLYFSVLLVWAAYTRLHSFWKLNTQSMGEFEFPLLIPALPIIAGTVMFLLVMAVRTLTLLIDHAAPLPPDPSKLADKVD